MNNKEKLKKYIILLIVYSLLYIILFTIFNQITLFLRFSIFIKYIYIFLLIIVLHFIFSIIFLKHVRKSFLYLSFISYMFIIIVTLYVRKSSSNSIIADPIYIYSWLKILFTNKVVFINIFGNIILFIPFGIYLKVFNVNIIFSLIFSLLIIILLELLQYIHLIGIFDINDILLNYLGTICGYIITKRGTHNEFIKR